MSSMGNKKILKAGVFFLMVVSILGQKQPKHMKLHSFFARFFLMFGFDYSEVMVFSGKQNATWKKPYCFGKRWRLEHYSSVPLKTAIESLNEMDHSEPTEKPFVATEDVVLVGFSTLLTRGILNTRLAFYRNYPSSPGQGYTCLCFLSAVQTRPQHGICNSFAHKLLLF